MSMYFKLLTVDVQLDLCPLPLLGKLWPEGVVPFGHLSKLLAAIRLERVGVVK